MAKNNISFLRLALLLIFAAFIAIAVFAIQWLLDLLGSNLLVVYNRPSHLSYLWYSSKNLEDSCRNCDDVTVDITYPLPQEGILPVGAEIRWEIRSPLFNESINSLRLENMRSSIVQDKNISNLTLAPCFRVTSFLDHANQFWESNKQDIFVFLPQKESTISMRMQAINNFNLLDHPASYTLEVAAKVGLCHVLNAVHPDSGEEKVKGVEFFEPLSPQNRIEIHQQRPFYSLQFQSPTESLDEIMPPSRQKDDRVLIVFPVTNDAVNAHPGSSSQAASNNKDNNSPQSSLSWASTAGGSSSRQPLITEESLFMLSTAASTVMKSSVEIQGETKAILSSSPTPAEISKLLSRKEALDWDASYLDTHGQNDVRSSLAKVNVLSSGLFAPPLVQLRNNIPKLQKSRKVYISFPEAMSSIAQSGPWDLAISFPLALLHVPGVQFSAMIDGVLYTLNLSGELVNVVQTNPTMLGQIKQRWEDATKEFIHYTSQYEVKELTRSYPQLQETRIMLTVEDFLPAFLETQVYQENLYGDLRQLSIVTLPELAIGWHHVEVFATIPSQFLRQQLLKSLNVMDNDAKSSASSLVIAFDSIRFQVMKH